ncbi:helix-turn-helix domain-containing protein [Salinimicrobium catena]|uniref:helix-turn-helix domain-containing protein n=1 Tax=Salinimicrobium catena TaxID=390640 RepID=UPI000B8048B7|nr:helix-turn-helix transcriptional regulator [Salinimicrobium catena]
MSEIELYVINEVKKRRLEKGISQSSLSCKMDMSNSFVSHVESLKRRAKYNLNHLNKLAEILECSPKDFWPEEPL